MMTRKSNLRSGRLEKASKSLQNLWKGKFLQLGEEENRAKNQCRRILRLISFHQPKKPQNASIHQPTRCFAPTLGSLRKEKLKRNWPKPQRGKPEILILP